MPDTPITITVVRPETPPPPPEGLAPVTPPALTKAFTTFALALAKEALLSPEERATKAKEIVAFVSKLLDVITQAADQWPACTPALPSLEEARAGITPPDRTCQRCACWRQYHEAWKATAAPAWWPNAEAATREELEAWIASRSRGTSKPSRARASR